MTNSQCQALGKQYLQDCYAQAPLCFAGGEGAYLVDVEGKRYLDCVGGIAVNALGYGDAELSEKLKETIDSGMLHCSNLFYNPHALHAAQLLSELSGLDRVFFCNSGAEANEAALKLARKYGKPTGRFEVISFQHSFHGRTMGAITATGQAKYQKSFLPLVPGFSYAVYNDLESVEKLVTDKSCAIICEALQGEGGVIPADPAFLSGLRKLCDEHDLLLIFDEGAVRHGADGIPVLLAALRCDAGCDDGGQSAGVRHPRRGDGRREEGLPSVLAGGPRLDVRWRRACHDGKRGDPLPSEGRNVAPSGGGEGETASCRLGEAGEETSRNPVSPSVALA
jgi:hypothetical protein